MATPESSSPTPSAQPKIVQKLLLRTSGFLFAFAAIFGGMRWWSMNKDDLDKGGDSTGLVAAIQMEREGQKAVLISPDGTIKATKSWKDGVTDREIVWSPDGKFLFFCTDRDEATFHVARWNPQKDDSEIRTVGRISRSNPTFAPGGAPDTLLVIAGGTVREFDPSSRRTPQVLPPTNAEITQSSGDEGPTTEGAFSAVYGSLGKSFRIARYFPDKSAIAAVMRRDEGELLIYQSLVEKNGQVPKPLPIAAGDRIDFDLNGTDGSFFYTVQNFRWPDPAAAPPQFRKGNRVTVPFKHMVGMFDPKQGQGIIAGSPDDKASFSTPRISPDGARLLLTQGPYKDGSLQPLGLLTLPARVGGIQQASPLVQGEVFEPSWSIDGKRVVYAKRVEGKRDLFTISAEGSDETNLTKGKGDFYSPLFSPMVAGG